MKLALLRAACLAATALLTSCCANDNDLLTVALDHSAGIHEEHLFPADCQPPQMFVPVAK